ncbi:MAG: thiamine pyrophosphate-binding protein [Burkholderiaceae bacterium]|nr:thiamine pyrophosphate-binding protein [Burkholderiaceae bacterium]
MDMSVNLPLVTPRHDPGTRVPLYQLLAEDIARLGAPVFGLMSDDTMLLAATLDALGSGFHGARHENSAIAMAEGYASATGELGIALIGRGPAAANALHGAVYASRTGSKVLLVFGEAASLDENPNRPGPDGKAFDAAGVLRAAGLPTFVARTPETARAVLGAAVQAARHGTAAALLLPLDVQRTMIDPGVTSETPVPADSTSRAAASHPTASNAMAAHPAAPRLAAPRPQAIAAAASMLSHSRKPLFVAGLGAHRAGAKEAIEALAEHTGGVLATTLKAKDMFRGNPWNLGIIGSFSHSAARQLIDQADCVVVFGASFNQRTTSGGEALPHAAPVIHVDLVRSHIGRWGPADLAVVGDAREVAQQLAAALPPRTAADKPFHVDTVRHKLAGFDMTSEFRPEHTNRTVDPRALAVELDRLLPADRNLVYDSGNFLQVVPYLGTRGPAHFKHTSDFFSVGMGFGTALGFASARPGEPTVLVIGDGGFAMTLNELDTAAREDIPLIVVVLNDCAYGAERHYLELERMPIARAIFPDVDYAPVAEAFGFRTATIRSLEDLRRAAPLLQAPDGPVLLDCKINAAIAAPFTPEMAAH